MVGILLALLITLTFPALNEIACGTGIAVAIEAVGFHVLFIAISSGPVAMTDVGYDHLGKISFIFHLII